MKINFDESLSKFKALFIYADSNDVKKYNENNPKDIPEGSVKSVRLTGMFGAWVKYKELAIKKNLIMSNYNSISYILSHHKLTDEEFLNLVFGFVNRNIEAGLLNPIRSFKKFINHNDFIFFSDLGKRMYTSLDDEETYNELVSAVKDFYMNTYDSSLDSLYDFFEDRQSEEPEFKQNHKLIKEHFLDKVDSFDYNDIEIVITALRKIGYREETCIRINKSLRKVLHQREKELLKEETHRKQELQSKVIVSEPIEQKPILPKKEFQTVYRELNKYYNFENMKPIRFLNLKEVIYCIHLMLKINFDENTINEFIESVEKENKKLQNNPISLFIRLYNKFKYYEKDINIQEKIKYIESLLGEIFICSEEDYEFWKSSIEEEIENLSSMIPSDNEYEVSEAKKIIKLIYERK